MKSKDVYFVSVAHISKFFGEVNIRTKPQDLVPNNLLITIIGNP